MKKEIKVGDYIKTLDGDIGQVVNINEFRDPAYKYAVEVNGYQDFLFLADSDIAEYNSNKNDILEKDNKNEIEKVLEELKDVRPEKLLPEAKRLFDAIMKIADQRDKYIILYEAEKNTNKELLTRLQADALIDRDRYWIKKNLKDLEKLEKQVEHYKKCCYEMMIGQNNLVDYFYEATGFKLVKYNEEDYLYREDNNE